MEHFIRTIVEAWRPYIKDNPRDWDSHRGTLTYHCSKQIPLANGCAPFELKLSIPPQPPALRPTTQDKQAITATQYLHRMQQWLGQMIPEDGKKMEKAQQNYKEYFDSRVRLSKNIIKPGTFDFARKKFYGSHDQRLKLASPTMGPFRIVSARDTTVVVEIDWQEESLSRQRIVAAPAARELMRRKVPRDKNSKSNTNVHLRRWTRKGKKAHRAKKNTSSIDQWVTRVRIRDESLWRGSIGLPAWMAAMFVQMALYLKCVFSWLKRQNFSGAQATALDAALCIDLDRK